MAAFEHVMVLVSFVYAVALTHLLSCAAAYIRSWPRLRFSWSYAVWFVNAFITIIVNWISFWDLRLLHTFSVGTILFVFLLAFTNYLQAALVCPHIEPDREVDLVRYHAEQGRRYVGASAATAGAALIANALLGGGYQVQEWFRQNIVVAPMLAITIIATVFVHTRWVQYAAGAALLGLWTYLLSTLQGALT